MPAVDFWYEFASTYSYLAVNRIERLAGEAGVAVRWRPFLLGPVFAAQGLTTSPFNVFEAKGRNMWRDMERLCAEEGLAFRKPDPFPQMSLLAARVALVGGDDGWIAPFSKSVYHAEFAEGCDISLEETIAPLLTDLGIDAADVLARAVAPENKERLKTQSAAAMDAGVFGAPSIVTSDGELFWGNDRLEQALRWARTHA